ncbi:MAG: hypothetical protein M3348_12665, partial [Acidobacteriota bacterium]|nr:hypothetical protein [Acidobacteriota bacterium]
FIEIKGQKPSEDELKKCRALSVYYPTFLFAGNIEPPNPNSFTGSWALCFPKAICQPLDSELIKLALASGFAQWHNGILTSFDPRPYCWHERLKVNDPQKRDDAFLLWPVPANEPATNPATGELYLVDPLTVGRKSINSAPLIRAYNAARSARFEFGEKGTRI